jgi:hypothetical protein
VTAPRFVREVLVPDQTVPLAVLAGCSTALADRESRQSASPDAVTQLEFAGHRITPGKTHTCTCHPAAGCRQILRTLFLHAMRTIASSVSLLPRRQPQRRMHQNRSANRYVNQPLPP